MRFKDRQNKINPFKNESRSFFVGQSGSLMFDTGIPTTGKHNMHHKPKRKINHKVQLAMRLLLLLLSRFIVEILNFFY